MPPFSRLFAPFPQFFQIAPHPKRRDSLEVEWLAANGDLFFRPRGGDGELLWCDLDYRGFDRAPLRSNRVTQMQRRISRVFHGRTFARVVPFPGQDRETPPAEWLLLRRRRALVKARTSPNAAHFELAIPLKGDLMKWLTQPLAWYQNAIAQCLENDDFELRDARATLKMSEQQQRERAIIWAKGDAATWEALARAMVILDWPATHPGATLHFTLSGMAFPHSLHFAPNFWCPPQARLQPLAKLLREHFEPQFHDKRWRRAHARGYRESFIFPDFSLAPPTQHERLEALMTWRDFLREKMAPDAIAQLLAPFTAQN